GQPLPSPGPPAIEDSRRGRYVEIFGPMYRGRTIMMMVVNFFQTIGYYGFISWIPTLLIAKGIHVTQSLEYTFVIALAYPVSPLIFMPAADRFQRKWQIAISCIAVAVVGVLFSQLDEPALLIIVGALQVVLVNWMAYAVHAYQSE